jgi:hypothetical protein
MSDNLTNITKQLGSAYAEAKKWDKSKTEFRVRFFEEISKQHETLATKISTVDAKDLASAIAISEQHNPGWLALSAMKSDGKYEVRMQEDPIFKPFTFINHDDGMVYQKQIVAGPVMFDDERLKSERPDVYDLVTFIPEPERQLKPLDEMNEETLAVLQDYIYEGKPIVKLAAPRKAKPEELE